MSYESTEERIERLESIAKIQPALIDKFRELVRTIEVIRVGALSFYGIVVKMEIANQEVHKTLIEASPHLPAAMSAELVDGVLGIKKRLEEANDLLDKNLKAVPAIVLPEDLFGSDQKLPPQNPPDNPPGS